jgi:hypothetical protein
VTTFKRIIVLPLSGVAKLALDCRFAVLSLVDPGDFAQVPPLWGFAGLCRLQFHDFDPVPDLSVPDSFRAKAMQPEHARDAWAFLSGLREDVEVLVVHCFAGVSRSPSAAMAIADAMSLGRSVIEWGGPVNNGDEFEDDRSPFRDYNPAFGSSPNRHVYRLMRDAAPATETGTGTQQATAGEPERGSHMKGRAS